MVRQHSASDGVASHPELRLHPNEPVPVHNGDRSHLGGSAPEELTRSARALSQPAGDRVLCTSDQHPTVSGPAGSTEHLSATPLNPAFSGRSDHTGNAGQDLLPFAPACAPASVRTHLSTDLFGPGGEPPARISLSLVSEFLSPRELGSAPAAAGQSAEQPHDVDAGVPASLGVPLDGPEILGNTKRAGAQNEVQLPSSYAAVNSERCGADQWLVPPCTYSLQQSAQNNTSPSESVGAGHTAENRSQPLDVCGVTATASHGESVIDSTQDFVVYRRRIFSKAPLNRDGQSGSRDESGSCGAASCSKEKGLAHSATCSCEEGTERDPLQHHRVWLRRIRGTPFSVCENCGTPFETRPGKKLRDQGSSLLLSHVRDTVHADSSPPSLWCGPVRTEDQGDRSGKKASSRFLSSSVTERAASTNLLACQAQTDISGSRASSASTTSSRRGHEDTLNGAVAAEGPTSVEAAQAGDASNERQTGNLGSPDSARALVAKCAPDTTRGCSALLEKGEKERVCHSEEEDEDLTPRRSYSVHRTESWFPTPKRTHSASTEDPEVASEGRDWSCTDILDGLKGVTWGWGCQRRPAATLKDYLGELQSGVAVPISQLPATMTCAIIANVPVAAALHGAWITGLITAVFGGSPLSITTVTSSLAVTLAKVTKTSCDEQTNSCHDEGLEFIFPALILSGVCCFLLGLVRLSRFSQFVPSATIVGYLNAVAILNVKAQVDTFRFDPVTSTGYEWLWVVLMIVVVFAVMCFWEKIPRITINHWIPSSFLAIGLSSFIEFVLVRRVCHMQTKTVASLSTVTDGDLWPKPFFFDAANVRPVGFYLQPENLMTMLELTLALVMVNYMSTLITVDMMSDKAPEVGSHPDQHLVSIGVANAVACFLGALPGSTAPSPSLLNWKLGGKGRESAIFCALVNLAFVAASAHILDYVPLGGLAGIIMYTAYHAFQWQAVAAMFASFLPARLRKKHPVLQRKICRSDAFVMLLTTLVALCADIGSAILSGVCISACVFAWKNRSRLRITSRIDPESGVKYYRVKGPIFFLTKRNLLKSFDVKHDPPCVVFELCGDACQLFDFGAMETLDTIIARYHKANKHVRVVGMQRSDKKMIVKAGRMFEFALVDIIEKPVDQSGAAPPIPAIADMMKLPC